MNKLKPHPAEGARMVHAVTGLTCTPARVATCGASCFGDGAHACRAPD